MGIRARSTILSSVLAGLLVTASLAQTAAPDEAAVRELYEETGYQTSLADASLLVERDYVFAGHHHRHTERFFFTTVAGSPSPAAFSEQEIATFLEARFVHPSKLVALDALVEPPHLGSLIAQLIPAE